MLDGVEIFVKIQPFSKQSGQEGVRFRELEIFFLEPGKIPRILLTLNSPNPAIIS